MRSDSKKIGFILTWILQVFHQKLNFPVNKFLPAINFNSLTFTLFFQFTKREPEDTKSADSDRDVFNEKPSKEEVMAATQAEGPKRVSDSAIIHTSMGDIHIKLFPVEYVLFCTCVNKYLNVCEES